jgi:sRNA-binding protein
MTTHHPLPSDLLPLLAATFPHTFFADPRQVQPLKLDIHHDLYAALPAGVERRQAQRFLYWYVSRAAYQKALLQGKGRIDLTGAVVDNDIPAAIRERAREHWQQLQRTRCNATSTNPTSNPRSVKPAPPAAPAPIAPLNLEDLYAMAIDAKLEVTLKFTTLPHAKPAGPGKMAFALKTPDGQFVTADVSNKVWNKLVKAAEDWPSWIAALTGPMGPRTEKGFTLANPGLQVFERKPKAPAEAASPLAESASPLAETLSAALTTINPVAVAPVPAVADPAEPAPASPATATANPDSADRKPVLSLKNRKATS